MLLLACDEQGADVHVVTLVESVHVGALRVSRVRVQSECKLSTHDQTLQSLET